MGNFTSRSLLLGALSASAFISSAYAGSYTYDTTFNADITDVASLVIPIAITPPANENFSSLTIEISNVTAQVQAILAAVANPVVANANYDVQDVTFYIYGPSVLQYSTVTLDDDLVNGNIAASGFLLPSPTERILDTGGWIQNTSASSIVLSAADLAALGVTSGGTIYLQYAPNSISTNNTYISYVGTIGGTVTYTYETETGNIPEPASIVGLGAGVAGCLLFRRRK